MNDSPSSRAPDPGRLLELGFAFWGSRTLLSAVELGLFTELAAAPADAETLRTRLGLHPRAARDFFDALVALGALERADGVYRNAPDADRFLDRNKPTYVGGMLEMCSVRLFRFWGDLTEGLRTGQAQNETKTGAPGLFETLYADPEKLRGFLAAMTGLSLGAARAIAEKFPWADHQSFADVGAAQGCVPVQVAQAHPHLRGVGYDLPVVRPIFEDYVAAAGLSDRVEFAPGDFFRDPLPRTDVIVMGHILHDWDLEEKRMLVRKAYDALPDGGALIVFEALIDDARRANAFGLLMSLNMLIETPGGFDFTGADCAQWMREAGFRETRVEHLAGPDSMAVGVK